MHNSDFMVLIIDDEPTIVQALDEFLLEEGFKTVTAHTGEEGLAKFREHHPQLVLADIRLPDMNGLDILKTIKTTTPESEVIMITGHGDVDSAIEALRSRASDFILKPITLPALDIAIQRAMERIRMAAELKAYTERLEDLVQQQVKELKEAHKKLEVLDRAKQNFLNLIAHELRTPLTAISASKMISIEQLNPDEAQFVEIIVNGYERLNAFVEKSLRYVSLLSRESLAPYHKTPFSSLVNQALDHVQELSGHKEITWNVILDEDSDVLVNIDSIITPFYEVFHNAVKFSFAGGSIEVTTKLNPNSISCFVRDHGVGIEPAFAENIFDIFSISDILHHGDGTGLSLAISRLILDIHAGTLEVESTGKDQGTTFIITLPIHRKETET